MHPITFLHRGSGESSQFQPESGFHFRYLEKSVEQTVELLEIYNKVYGSCNTTLLAKVQVMQNKLLKILYNKDRRYSTNTLHHELKLLQVKDIHELLLLKFIHTVLNGNPVKRFEAYFIKRRQTHDYETRQADYIQTAKCKTTYGKRRVHYISATKWNNLEETVKTMKLSAFKLAVTEQKIGQYRA